MDSSALDFIASLKTQTEIAALPLRYATATDTVGRGDVEAGRRIYHTCFTSDALVESILPDQKPGDPPLASVTGPDAFTDMVNDIFRKLGCTATHHQIGNIQITVDGNSATMTSYVIAYHIMNWNSKVDFATARYIDRVVQTPDGWRIAHRQIRGSSFLRLEPRDNQALSELVNAVDEVAK